MQSSLAWVLVRVEGGGRKKKKRKIPNNISKLYLEEKEQILLFCEKVFVCCAAVAIKQFLHIDLILFQGYALPAKTIIFLAVEFLSFPHFLSSKASNANRKIISKLLTIFVASSLIYGLHRNSFSSVVFFQLAIKSILCPSTPRFN